MKIRDVIGLTQWEEYSLIILQALCGYRLPTAVLALFYMCVLKACICVSLVTRDVLGEVHIHAVCVDSSYLLVAPQAQTGHC